MAMIIDDRTVSFAAMADEFAHASSSERQRLWAEYESRHHELFEFYYSEWASRHRVPTRLPRLAAETRLVAERAGRLRALIPTVAEATAAELGQRSAELHFVLFVGVYASNAWVTSFRERPTAFFCVEQLPDIPYDEILVAHETAHALHQIVRQGHWRDTSVLHRLFEEGLATLSSAVARTDHADGDYLWFAPGFDGWVRDCAAAWPVIRNDLLAAAPDSSAAIAALFHAGRSHRQLPDRSGYYAGLKVLRELKSRYSLNELIAWSANRATDEVRRSLFQLPR
jgi:hypothetical protein